MSQVVSFNFQKPIPPGTYVQTLTPDSGGAVSADGLGNINVLSGALTLYNNFDTIGNVAPNTVNFRLKDYLRFPATNAALTTGNIQIGGDRFIHAYGTANTFIGQLSGNTTLNVGLAVDNTGIGFETLFSVTTGQLNAAGGMQSMQQLTTSSGNAAWGFQALNALTSGSGLNTALGRSSLLFLQTGDNNTCLGYNSGSAYITNESSNIIIGSNTVGTIGDNNVIRIGTQGGASGQQNRCFIAGIVGVTTSNSQLVTIDSTTGQLGVTDLQPFPWTVITLNQTAAVNNGYFCNKAGTLALALPASSSVGDVIEVSNINTALGIQFTQAAGQQIFIGNTSTTLGALGTLTTTAVGDALKMVCSAANTWRVVSMVGNWTPA